MMLPLSGWSYCKPITVQHAYVDADITDVVYTVYITGDTDIGAHALANGFDLRFTSADGTTILGYWRRSFAIAAGAATGICQVQVPALATAGGDIIYCHYGNAAAPDVSSKPASQSPGTKRYWPLNEAYSTAAGNYKDVMGVGDLTLTDADGDSAQGTGPIDKAVDLNGDADFLTDADHADHDPGGAMTIEAWVNFDVLPSVETYIVVHDLSAYKWMITYHPGTTRFRFYVVMASGASTANKTITPSTDSWIYLSGTFDKTLSANRLNLYLGGILVGSGTGYAEDITAGDEGIRLGSNFYINGKIAEVRYSNIARSAAWIKFTYRNITEADHEATWGTEVGAPSGDIFLFGANF